MSRIGKAVDEYLAVRRSLGFELKRTEWLLRHFVRFADYERARFITIDLALRWVKLSPHVQAAERSTRLRVVRQLAQFLSASDPRTEVPSADLLPSTYQRRQPYIYSDEEVMQLVRAAEELASPTGLRAWTYRTLFGLLAVTGMRHSEALALDRGDVDLDAGILTIRRTKCRKTRLVPVHETARAAARVRSSPRPHSSRPEERRVPDF
jgi:site-specific recombinase XerD